MFYAQSTITVISGHIFDSPWIYALIVIIDNFSIALVSGVHKLTVLYKIVPHFLSEKNIVYDVVPAQKGTQPSLETFLTTHVPISPKPLSGMAHHMCGLLLAVLFIILC